MNAELITQGPVTCLNVTGLGEPGGAEHLSAIGALHAVAGPMGGPAGPMEGLWWVEDERPGLEVPREQWRWHLLLPLPATPEPGQLEQARESVRTTCPAVDRVRVTLFTEGQCVQMLHHGPFSEEPVTLKAMEEFMAEHGLVPNGPHHEVYLTTFDDPDPRTLLRQPVRPA